MLHGLGTKRIDYSYNSQDQITNLAVLAGDSEVKAYRYRYDIPGRLSHLDIPDDPAADNPFYFNLARYLYNQNSLISSLRLNAENITNDYLYYERNWILTCNNNLGIFNYFMSYYPNGNVAELQLSGNYKNNFSDDADMNFEFNYDKSNRLLNAISNYNGIDNAFNLRNTYDRDGNILTLKRYLSNGSFMDNFNYTYYSQTNKLKNTGNEFDDYEYDLNGNLIKDDMNKNVEIKYDHRNLITFIKHHVIGHHGEVYTQAINYFYDEAGNRVRKVILRAYKKDPVVPENLDNLEEYPVYEEETFNQAAEDYYNQLDQPGGPIGDPADEDNPFLIWYVMSNEFYIRGVEGNELVIMEKYSGGEQVMKYNFFGSGNEGYIDAGDRKYFYLKDHLGSVRVALDESNNIVSAQDYDMWGYLMQGRSFDSNAAKYKFTGKERDRESNYDYFGARYYDARIGRWGGVDPQLSKSPFHSPFQYAKLNPLAYIDPNGREEIKIVIRSYIPTFFALNFMGDDRGPDVNSTNYRTEHTLRVETTSNNPKLSEDFNVGLTAVLIPNPTSPNIPRIQTGKAKGAYSSNAQKINSNQVIINMSGSASDPLVPGAPPVTYDVNIYIAVSNNGEVIGGNIKGEHTNYPAFEMYLIRENGEVIELYTYPTSSDQDPNNPITGPFGLFGTREVETASKARKLK
jgi:RHS repeat-associated protein